jgi:hypothetical protein
VANNNRTLLNPLNVKVFDELKLADKDPEASAYLLKRFGLNSTDEVQCLSSYID